RTALACLRSLKSRSFDGTLNNQLTNYQLCRWHSGLLRPTPTSNPHSVFAPLRFPPVLRSSSRRATAEGGRLCVELADALRGTTNQSKSSHWRRNQGNTPDLTPRCRTL